MTIYYFDPTKCEGEKLVDYSYKSIPKNVEDEKVEAAEELRQQKETERQEAESGRIEAEQSRVDAEAKRQSEFETNEANRTVAFNTKEATRQQAEAQRATAESVRVANEAERISKDSERDSKIDRKADVSALELYAKKKQEEWITPTLLNGWTTFTDTPIQYRKDEFGVVRFRGRINQATKTDIQFMTMPYGYRPVNNAYINFGGDQFMYFGKAGVCQSYITKWKSLEGFSYSTI